MRLVARGASNDPAPGPKFPGQGFVYMLMNAGELVYIGSTGSLPMRLTAHRPTRVFDEWIAWGFPTRGDAYVAEHQWITYYDPPGNRYAVHVESLADAEQRSTTWTPPEDVVPVSIVAPVGSGARRRTSVTLTGITKEQIATIKTAAARSGLTISQWVLRQAEISKAQRTNL